MSARSLRSGLVLDAGIFNAYQRDQFVRVLRLALEDGDRFADFEVEGIINVVAHQIDKALGEHNFADEDDEPDYDLTSDDLVAAYVDAQVAAAEDVVSQIRALIAEALA